RRHDQHRRRTSGSGASMRPSGSRLAARKTAMSTRCGRDAAALLVELTPDRPRTIGLTAASRSHSRCAQARVLSRKTMSRDGSDQPPAVLEPRESLKLWRSRLPPRAGPFSLRRCPGRVYVYSPRAFLAALGSTASRYDYDRAGWTLATKVGRAMMLKRIDHVEIVTDRLDRTVRFYTEVLGFTLKARDRIERSGLGVPIDLVYLDLGGTVVELIAYEGIAVDPAPQTEHLGYRMMALEVDDMQKTADYLRTQGVDIVWGPRVRETYSRAEICDPNGYRIELRQWFR